MTDYLLLFQFVGYSGKYLIFLLSNMCKWMCFASGYAMGVSWYRILATRICWI